MRHITVVLILIITILTASCGAGKELKESRVKADSLGAVVSQLNSQVTQLTSEVNQLNGQVSQLNDLQVANDATIERLKNNNAVATQEAYDCIRARDAVAGRMFALSQAMTSNSLSMRDIQKGAAKALEEFAGTGVEVSYNNGLVDISMQDDLLFNPGSARLGKNGKEALGIVASVLNDNPNLKIYVIGNTDSVQVTRGYADNWSLSTERANSVVRVLQDQYHVAMDRVTSGGRGKYNPVADNTTPEGRAKNRRTEIILNPDLSGFWNLADKSP
jgi:chemotaxis protein MotB